METKKMRQIILAAAMLLLLTLSATIRADWTVPVPLTEVNTEYAESSPFLSYDGLSLYFTRRETDTFYHSRIYEARRDVPEGPFTSVTELSELNSGGRNVIWPWVSADNLRMYYSKSVTRLIFSERASVGNPWPQGSDITELNALGSVYDPTLTTDELTILFHSPDIAGGYGGYDLWMAARSNTGSPFGNVRNLDELNTSYNELNGFICSDGLTLYFSSDRNGIYQIFRATRPSVSDPFGCAVHIAAFDTPWGSRDPSISSDGTAFYFGTMGSAPDKPVYVSYAAIEQWVAVDIKPGACPNPLNLSSRGVLPVAILGSEELDVNSIDVSSIRLEGIAPMRSGYEDVAAPVADGEECGCTTEGPDGYTDLMLKFQTQAVVTKLLDEYTDLAKNDVVVLTLTGVLTDQTPIEGEDCIVIKGKYHNR